MQNFSFIQITDHHLLESEEAHREGFVPGHALRMVMKHIAEHTADKADFIISTGDLVEPSTEAAYNCAIKLLGLSSSAALPGPQKVNSEGLRDFPMYFLWWQTITDGNSDCNACERNARVSGRKTALDSGPQSMKTN